MDKEKILKEIVDNEKGAVAENTETKTEGSARFGEEKRNERRE